ncbi:MAG: hypothetical protein LBK60_11420 [Verrucomicrobiales bacterium]|jgi:hypothetical protein|nr:hypothetical protein [Verrucomicrobiales bacterium]
MNIYRAPDGFRLLAATYASPAAASHAALTLRLQRFWRRLFCANQSGRDRRRRNPYTLSSSIFKVRRAVMMKIWLGAP